MNGPFIVAQANTTGTAPIKPVKVVKVTKPSDGPAITVELGHDHQTKVDLTELQAHWRAPPAPASSDVPPTMHAAERSPTHSWGCATCPKT